MKAVILAAGRGNRLEPLTGDTPKCMLPLAGKPILEHVLKAVRKAGIREVVLVVGYKEEKIREHFGEGSNFGIKIGYISQKKQLGTAHAIGKVEQVKDFLVLNGDTLISSACVEDVLSAHSAGMPSAATLGLRKVEEPSSYGVVRLKNSRVVEIIEKPKEHVLNLANAGIYAFSPKIFEAIRKTKKSERGEYEITSSIGILIKEGEVVRGAMIKGLWSDIGNPWTYLDSNQEMLDGMEERIWGEIEEFVKRRGKLYLGRKSIIKSGSCIEGPVYIGDNTIIGPNAYLRSFASIGNDCKIGNGVEVKNSIIMDCTNVPHLSYIGDSIIGRNCNIGAGTLVGNLRLDEKNVKMRIRNELKDTGRRKFGCVIGDNVKLGINVMINAGRKIGSNSLIGPGVIVYKDVPQNSFILQKQELRRK